MRTMPGRVERPFTDEESRGSWKGLAEMPDDAIACVPGSLEDLPELPGATYAADIRGLRRIVREFTTRNYGWAEGSLLAEIPHEQEHAAAAQALGCRSRFFFRVAPTEGGGRGACLGHSWVARAPMTKLAVASIAAAPSYLSAGDLNDIRRMGYRDADDVAGRIRLFNRTAKHPLTMPGSVRA